VVLRLTDCVSERIGHSEVVRIFNWIEVEKGSDFKPRFTYNKANFDEFRRDTHKILTRFLAKGIPHFVRAFPCNSHVLRLIHLR
jgi:hypothetical protein